MSNEEYSIQFHTYLLTEKRVSKNTLDAYKRDIQQFFNYCIEQDLTFEELKKSELTKYLAFHKKKGLKSRSLARKISALKQLFSYLHEHYQLPNVAAALSTPKIEKNLPTYLTEQEVQKLLVAAKIDTSPRGVRDKVMLYLLYASGLRVSELVSLTIDQIRFDTGFLQLMGKGKKERHVPLPRNMIDLLRSYCDSIRPQFIRGLQEQADCLYLFPVMYRKTIKPISRQLFWLSLKKLLSHANLFKNVSPHTLRHSLATHLLKNGADIRSLQMLLGHESLATIQVYTHLDKSDVRKVYDKKHPRA